MAQTLSSPSPWWETTLTTRTTLTTPTTPTIKTTPTTVMIKTTPTTATIKTASTIPTTPTTATIKTTSTISTTSTAIKIAPTTTFKTTPTTLTTPKATSIAVISFQTTSSNPTITAISPTHKNTTIPTHHREHSLDTGQKAGIAVGVLLLFFAVCSAFGWSRYRRKPRKDSQGYAMPERMGIQSYDPKGSEALATPYIYPVPYNNPGALTHMYDQPKDDDAMIRLFREVDGRLTDHVLNYYVASDGEIYGDEISTLPREVRRDLEKSVSKLVYLLPKQESRMFVLRAIIADRIMRAVLEDIQVPDSVSSDPKHGVQAVAGSSSGKGVYEFPENATLGLAQAACTESEAFAIDKSNSDARLRSMQTLVRNAGAFAMTMKRQPTRFELVWLSSSEGELSNKVAFDPQTMEVAHREPREGHSGPGTVRGAVFPGLQKIRSESGRKEERLLLAKIQVLLY